MELAGVFLTMVVSSPWNGPLKPLCCKVALTVWGTVV